MNDSTTDWSGRERRLHPRADVSLRVRFRKQNESFWHAATTLDLSAGGAALVCSEALPEFTELRPLLLVLPGREEPIRVNASVLRCRALPNRDGDEPAWVAGVHFLDLTPEAFETVRRFVFEKLQDSPA